MANLNIVSFPKSGRTWLRVMLDDVGADTWFTHDDSDHALRRQLEKLNPDKAKYLDANVLLLVRDPRDTAVSGFFQVTRRIWQTTRPMSEVLRDERHGLRKVCRFNLLWFAAASRMQRFAVLSYEQMKQAPAEALIAVAARAGLTLDRETAQQVAANRDFSRMQAAEGSGELAGRYGKLMLPGDRSDPESFKVRRGVVGGYKDYLSEADLAYCDDVLAETGYWAQHDQALARWGVLGAPFPSIRDWAAKAEGQLPR
jgi:hypothetical protein